MKEGNGKQPSEHGSLHQIINHRVMYHGLFNGGTLVLQGAFSCMPGTPFFLASSCISLIPSLCSDITVAKVSSCCEIVLGALMVLELFLFLVWL